MSCPERLYTADEAAQLLRVHAKTLRRWMRAGKIGYRKVGPSGLIRFTGAHLNEVCEEVVPLAATAVIVEPLTFRDRVYAPRCTDDRP
jgi:excisionase family DNA binding protein